jgi:hypothetical protein
MRPHTYDSPALRQPYGLATLSDERNESKCVQGDRIGGTALQNSPTKLLSLPRIPMGMASHRIIYGSGNVRHPRLALPF